MRIVADEGIEATIVEALRAAGHEVTYIAERYPGISDDEVLEFAVQNESLLLTGDKDFGELVFRRRLAHTGVFLLRLAGLSAAQKAASTCSAIHEHRQELLGRFAVLDERSLRIRRAPS